MKAKWENPMGEPIFQHSAMPHLYIQHFLQNKTSVPNASLQHHSYFYFTLIPINLQYL